MQGRFKIIISSVILVTAVLVCQGYAEGDYKLKKGAKGKLCLNCHIDFSDTLKKAFVHTPVKNGECSNCHNPHTAAHGMLLAFDPDQICAQCHGSMVPENPVSEHQVVSSGECSSCHDPHASDNKNSLLAKGNRLCFGCHADIQEQLKGLAHPHAPVTDDCLSCHNPHGSEKGDFLLSANPPDLCKDCHETSGKKFLVMHLNYPVAETDCTTCHNPHGSNQKAIFYDNVHIPVAKKMCNQCHESPDSANPLALKSEGYFLCRGCHNQMVNETWAKKLKHSPLLSGKGCLSCHEPHASKRKYLMPGPLDSVCGQCHDDTIRRHDLSVDKHEPIGQGECSSCHDPHASDYPLLALEENVIPWCNSCHEGMDHSSHPMGDKYVDKRNPNLNMDCLSCHRAHGTEYKNLNPFVDTSSLCTQCHEELRR